MIIYYSVPIKLVGHFSLSPPVNFLEYDLFPLIVYIATHHEYVDEGLCSVTIVAATSSSEEKRLYAED